MERQQQQCGRLSGVSNPALGGVVLFFLSGDRGVRKHRPIGVGCRIVLAEARVKACDATTTLGEHMRFPRQDPIVYPTEQSGVS